MDSIQEKHEFEREKIDKKQEKKQEEQMLPAYFKPIDDLTPADEERIIEEIWDEWNEIEQERAQSNREGTWDSLLNQYKSKMAENEDRQFNLSRPTTKIKIRGISRLMHRALFESDPIYTVVPRPEFHREGGQDVADKQTDFLDYKMDVELPFKQVKRKVINSACIYGVGIEKMFHKIERRKRKRSETWKGNPIVMLDRRTGAEVIINKSLERLLAKYPDLPDSYIKDMQEGKEIHFEVDYMETVKNDPLPKMVDIRNFYVRESCEGYDGLCDQLLIGEKVEYSWWELKRMERRGIFKNIDRIKFETNDNGKLTANVREGYKNKEYTIRECTYQAKLKDNDEEETKCVFWIEEETKTLIGTSYYPWDGLDCIYNPHYVLNEEDGFYQPGIAEDLTDLNIAENLFLNFGLEGAWLSNMVTPITPRGSDIDQQFLTKDWAHGLPLNAEPDEQVDFLQKYMKPTNLRDVIVILQTIAKASDDVSGYSQLLTGRESELDPRAPASKTIALMQRSGINIRDYIKCLLPAFNRTAEMLLQMYYQISQEGRAYKMRPERITGEQNLFSQIKREEMIARTNIEAKASSFDFDKINERKQDLALYQVVRQELLIAKNPQAVHMLLKNLIKGWSPKWRNIGEQLLPPLQELQQKEMGVALQASAAYLGKILQASQQQGQPVEQTFDIQKLLQAVNTARKDLATMPTEEELEARKEAAEGGK